MPGEAVEPKVGRELGHYLVLEKLGEGGMGEVYLAEDTQLRRKVALKLLPPEMAGDPERLKRFRREAKTVAALSHPNIVTIHAVEEIDGVPLLVMEYVRGRTLGDAILPGGLPVKTWLEIATALAEALRAAHERGILHRDLKPSNIMLGPDGWVKVLDFGLAKLRPDSEPTEIQGRTASIVETHDGRILGTPRYMSPEQLRGLPLDARSDLFSLGVVLFEMSSGIGPFDGENTAERVAAVLRDAPKPLAAVRPELPRAIVDVVERCLEKDPEKRFQSAGELKEALTDLKRKLEISELLESGALPKQAIAGPMSRAPWIAGALVLAALVGLLAWRMATLRSKHGAAMAADPRPSLAVLPLHNFSNEPDYFIDGMTDALISSIANVRALRVISRQSVMRFKGSDKPLPEIAKELGVDLVLEGSLARFGDRVRVTTQLVRANPEENLFARTFDGATKDLLTLEANAAQEVARMVRVRLTPQEQARFASVHEVDPAVYENYLRGRYFLGQRTPESMQKAAELFESCVGGDPQFALGYAGLAEANALLGYLGGHAGDTLLRAKTLAKRALELDPALAEAYVSLGLVQFSYEWRLSEAEASLRKATDLNPNLVSAHYLLWGVLASSGRLDEAEREIETARSLDPLSLVIQANAGVQHYLRRDFEKALVEYDKTLALEPGFALAHLYKWSALAHLGRTDEGLAELTNAMTLMGYPEVTSAIEKTRKNGSYEEALIHGGEALAALPPERHAPVEFVADFFAEAGDSKRALDWLERGLADREPVMLWIGVLPSFERLHGDPRFERLLDAIRKAAAPN